MVIMVIVMPFLREYKIVVGVVVVVIHIFFFFCSSSASSSSLSLIGVSFYHLAIVRMATIICEIAHQIATIRLSY